jgi:hypothetical protein
MSEMKKDLTTDIIEVKRVAGLYVKIGIVNYQTQNKSDKDEPWYERLRPFLNQFLRGVERNIDCGVVADAWAVNFYKESLFTLFFKK